MPLPFRRAARRTATFRSPTTLHKPRSSTRRPVVNGTGVPSAPGHRSRRRPVRGHPTRLSTITAATATISKPARLRCEEPRVSAAPLRWVAAVVAAATERSVKPRHSVRSSAHCAHRTARCLCRQSGRPLATSPHGPTARSSSADQRLARAGPPRPLNPISRRTTAMLHGWPGCRVLGTRPVGADLQHGAVLSLSPFHPRSYRTVTTWDCNGRTLPKTMRPSRGGLPGKDAERCGMGPAVVLGQDLTEATGPVRHGAVADLATGDRQLGNGHREAAGRGLAHMPQ